VKKEKILFFLKVWHGFFAKEESGLDVCVKDLIPGTLVNLYGLFDFISLTKQKNSEFACYIKNRSELRICSRVGDKYVDAAVFLDRFPDELFAVLVLGHVANKSVTLQIFGL